SRGLAHCRRSRRRQQLTALGRRDRSAGGMHGVGIAAMDVIPKRLAALHLFVGATRSAGRPDFARTPVSPPSWAAGPRVGGLWYLVSATFRLVRWDHDRTEHT